MSSLIERVYAVAPEGDAVVGAAVGAMPLTTRLNAVETAIAALAGMKPAQLAGSVSPSSAAEILTRLEAVHLRLAAVFALLVADADLDAPWALERDANAERVPDVGRVANVEGWALNRDVGAWAVDDGRAFPEWVRERIRRLEDEAARTIREAHALRDHLPATAAALAAGEITPEHISILVRGATVTPACVAALADPDVGEAWLLAQARMLDAARFHTVVKDWASRVDPGAVSPVLVNEGEPESSPWPRPPSAAPNA